MDVDGEWVEEVWSTAAKLAGVVDKEFIEAMLHIYALEDSDKGRDEVRREIESILAPFSRELLLNDKPLLECPSAEEAAGEIYIGDVCGASGLLWGFGLSREELNQHVLLLGRSGHGKTVLIMNIIGQLMELGIPFLAFDFKRDLRHLIRHFSMWVFRWSDLRINLLQPPPGVGLKTWEGLFCDLYAFTYGWFHGSRNMLQEYLHELYESEGSKATLPKLYELIKNAEERTRKRQEYYDVVANRLFSTVTNLGDVISCEESMDIEELLRHPCVIELDGLPRDEQNLLVDWFLFWIYAYRLAQEHRGVLKHVLIFDEAKRVFDANKELRQTTEELGVAPIDIITDEIREFGEALIVSDQEPSKLTHSIKANTYTKICGSLGHGGDIADIAEAMNLSDEERKAISMLERGEWIVKLSGRYTKPFMIRTRDFPVKKDVSDGELAERMKPVIERLMPKIEPKSAYLEGRKAKRELSEDAWRLLININGHPFNGISARAKQLRLSPRRIESAKRELIENGLVMQVEIPLTGRRPTAFLVLTRKALKFLRSRGVETKLWNYIGNVGFEHLLYQVLVRWEFKKLGYDAHIEAKLPSGRRIDVLAVKGDRRIGVEVELNANVDLKAKLKVAEELDALYIVTSRSKFSEVRARLGKLPPKTRLYSIDRMLMTLRNLGVKEIGINSSGRKKMKPMPRMRNKSSASSEAGRC